MINMARGLEESLYEIETKAEQIRALEFIERDAIEETYRTTKRIAKNDDDELFWLGYDFNILFKEQFQYLLELRIKLSEEIKELVKLNIINNLELFVVQSPHRSEMSYNVELNYQNKTGQCSCEMFTIEECSCIHTLAVYRYINIHKNFYREKIRGSPQNAIPLCLRIEMFPLVGQKIGAYVAEELLEELDEKGELETSVSEIMNQLAASNESLEGCLPISSILSLAM